MWNVDDAVEVRASSTQEWTQGVVAAVLPDCYRVALNTPMTANDWLGNVRPRKGDELVYTVSVLKHCSTLAPDKHIRTPA